MFSYKEDITVLPIECVAQSNFLSKYGHSNASLSTYLEDRLGRAEHEADPDGHSFTITYTYAGDMVASEDIFTSALDGLSDSALHAKNYVYTSFIQRCQSHNCKLVIGMWSAQSRMMPLSYVSARETPQSLSFDHFLSRWLL